MEVVTLGGETGHTVGLAELNLRLHTLNVASVAWDLLLWGSTLLVLIGFLKGSLVTSVAGDLSLLGFKHFDIN